MHSTFKVLWNTLPAVWNIKVKLTDISLVFGLYSDVIRMYWALCVDCTLKKYISSYISKVHKSKNWIVLGNAWSENCLHQSSDFSKTEFPWYVWHVYKTCPNDFSHYLIAVAWHKSLSKCKVICASRRGRRFWINNPRADQSVHVLIIFYSQHIATHRVWV